MAIELIIFPGTKCSNYESEEKVNYLKESNTLSEFDLPEEKEAARSNLDIYSKQETSEMINNTKEETIQITNEMINDRLEWEN